MRLRNARISPWPSIAKVEPEMFLAASSTDENVCNGWRAPSAAPCRSADSRTSREAAPEVWTTPCPRRHEMLEVTGPMASSGVVMNTTSAASAASPAVG